MRSLILLLICGCPAIGCAELNGVWQPNDGGIHDARQVAETLHGHGETTTARQGRSDNLVTGQSRGGEAAGRSVAAICSELAELKRVKLLDRTDAQRERIVVIRRALEDANARYAESLDRTLANCTATTNLPRLKELAQKQLDIDLRGVVAELRQRSGRNVAVIQYLVCPGRLHILLTLPEAHLIRQIEVTEAQLNREIEALRLALRDPRSAPTAPAQVLYQRLLAPIAAELRDADVQLLMLDLDGALRYLPFAALYDGTHYLTEDYALSVYSAAAQPNLIDMPDPADSWAIAAFGTSKPRLGLAPSPGVAAELEAIVKTGDDDPDGLLPGVIQIDEDFSLEALRDRLAEGYPVVHIASHFVLVPGTAHDSFLLLGDGSRLNMHELSGGAYRFNRVELLTLSACDTAVGGGEDAQGREVEGLATLAQKMGAKAVLATLWTVADQSTGLFIQKFYSLLSEQHLSKAEALRRTQLAFLAGPDATRGVPMIGGDNGSQAARGASRDYRHPYYWAPFILMGNWL